MLSIPTSLRRTLLGGLCASALIVGGCSGGDKAPAEEISVDVATLDLSKADEAALARHFETMPRSGAEEDTLALLALADFEGATYAERLIDGANVVYTDWSADNEEGSVTADRVEMIGLHEVDGAPTLDRLNVRGMRLKGYDENEGERFESVDATLAALTVVGPSTSLFSDLADILAARDSGSDTATQAVSGSESFRALRIEDMNATVNDATRTGVLSVGQIVVGNDADEELLDAVVEQVDFTWSPPETENGADSGEPFTLAMDGLTLLSLDTDAMVRPVPQGVGAMAGVLSGALSVMGPSAKPLYQQVDLGKMDISSSLFDLTTDGFEADADVDGDTTTLRTVLEPLELTLKDLSTTPLAPFMDALRENGLDVITLKGSSTTTFDRGDDRVSYRDNGTEIDGGLRMRCNYDVQGLNAAAASLEASGATPPVFEMDEDEDPQEVMERFQADAQAYAAAQTEANKLILLEALDCTIQDVADNSLVERGYAAASTITGRPVAVLKGGAKTMIALSSLTAQSEFQRDLMDTLGSGLIDFIDTPGQTLTVTIAPDTPVAITALTGEDGSEPSIRPLNLSVDVQ
ncbi:MAG: hypothetical protein WBG08_12735 [Litorimonas sp.]